MYEVFPQSPVADVCALAGLPGEWSCRFSAGQSHINNNNNVNNNNNLRLQVQRAIYGYNGKGNDVTNRVRSQIRNNQINMQVTNDTMGGDPNHGNKKNLKVMYTYGNNKSHTKYVNEKDWLRIP